LSNQIECASRMFPSYKIAFFTLSAYTSAASVCIASKIFYTCFLLSFQLYHVSSCLFLTAFLVLISLLVSCIILLGKTLKRVVHAIMPLLNSSLVTTRKTIGNIGNDSSNGNQSSACAISPGFLNLTYCEESVIMVILVIRFYV